MNISEDICLEEQIDFSNLDVNCNILSFLHHQASTLDKAILQSHTYLYKHNLMILNQLKWIAKHKISLPIFKDHSNLFFHRSLISGNTNQSHAKNI